MKENHGFRYTQIIGKARMEMKVRLTFSRMNLKKLAGIMDRKGLLNSFYRKITYLILQIINIQRK